MRNSKWMLMVMVAMLAMVMASAVACGDDDDDDDDDDTSTAKDDCLEASFQLFGAEEGCQPDPTFLDEVDSICEENVTYDEETQQAYADCLSDALDGCEDAEDSTALFSDSVGPCADLLGADADDDDDDDDTV